MCCCFSVQHFKNSTEMEFVVTDLANEVCWPNVVSASSFSTVFPGLVSWGFLYGLIYLPLLRLYHGFYCRCAISFFGVFFSF
jgi:hypothetical protein